MTERFPFYKPNESEITQEIRRYLKIRGVWHFKQWQGLGSFPGISDIIGLYRGIGLFIEVKTSKGKLSEVQMNFLKMVNINQGLGVVVRSVEDIIEICDGLKNGKDLSVLREKFSH